MFVLICRKMYLTLIVLLLSTPSIIFASGKQIAMKIVEEPTNYGFNTGGFNNQEEVKTLHMRISPSNFSGPQHLRQLLGHCFTKIIDSYKYEFCPYSNITQHEQSLRWNPYSGVLGVWQEWDIVNNTFVAMVMSEGDSCGSVHRTTKVYLQCGNTNQVVNVSEPKTCNYKLVFTTPLVCHPHSILVYPTLNKTLQQEWNLIEGRLQAEEITQKGYDKLLQHLFEKAGYRVPAAAKEKMIQLAKKKEQDLRPQSFETLFQCQSEYNKLKEQVEALRTVLQVNGIHDTTQDKKEHSDGLDDDTPHSFNHMDYEWMHGHRDY
ncbi:hypothetical protein LSH36_179g03037 [Paralvinella palmiformis]|uniref:N-acetylglucosamine-1-phosphotransferase subunit gamma n=1 Tax=Paralvinella palmiformis TaxID=53620 RepID=A0AAD9N7L5_9ANNE|nr:hypothetical protein LSH36_179g03037 [Paralvinella palmiformis]